MEFDKNEMLKKYLSGFITSHKLERIEEVLSNRTRHFAVVLEDIHKSHNASAVIRNCDAVGVQDLCIIENECIYKVNPYVTRGAAQWISLYRFNKPEANNTESCYQSLKAKGYKIYATAPGPNGRSIEDIDISEKIAFAFGNEYTGLSSYAIKNADSIVQVPMYGFTESYNISVTAAICLFNQVQKLHKSTVSWKLTEEEKDELRLDWYKKIVKNSDIHTRLFLSKNAPEL